MISMSVKSTKLDGGGEIGELSQKKGRLPHLRDRFKGLTIFQQLAVVFSVAVGLLLAVTVISLIYNSLTDRIFKEQSREAQYAQEFLKSDGSDKTKSDLVKRYSTQYDQALSNNSKSDPGKWSKQDLDNAYAALLYADKVEDYNQVNTLIAYIEFAKSRGLNIDDNSYGIDQQVRDAIKQRVDAFNNKAKATETKN